MVPPGPFLLGRLHPLRGGGIGGVVACVRYHEARRRRSSVRSTLERLCKVEWSPVGVAVGFAEGE